MTLPINRMGVRASDLIIEPSSNNKSDKVMPTLEQALKGVVIEWENQNGI
jgi:hypothetical protein